MKCIAYVHTVEWCFDNDDWSCTTGVRGKSGSTIFLLSVNRQCRKKTQNKWRKKNADKENIRTNKHILIDVVYVHWKCKYNGKYIYHGLNIPKKPLCGGNTNALAKGSWQRRRRCWQWCWWSPEAITLKNNAETTEGAHREKSKIQIQEPQPNKQDHKPKTTSTWAHRVCRERRKKRGKPWLFHFWFGFVGVAFLLPPFQLGHNNNNNKKNTSGGSLVCVPAFRNNNGKTVFFSSHFFPEPKLQYNENRKTNELVYMRTNETSKYTERERASGRNEEKK